MACFSPLTGYRPKDGSATLTFDRALGQVDTSVEVACGQCKGCRLESCRQWAVRCMHEAQMHERNSFITLTYNNQNLPADLSVDVEHWKLFAKRLRYYQGKFRYYHCGEYGEATPANGMIARPHYHALIFGLDFFEDRKFWKNNKSGDRLYTCEALDEIWGKGFTTIGEVTQQSAGYVARYTMKKLNGKKAEAEYGERCDPRTGEISFYRQPPYATMSLRPGIGASWFEKYYLDVYPSDEVVVDGRKTRPPRFYDKELAKFDPVLLDEIKHERGKTGNLHKSNNTPERLAVREYILEEKTKRLTRSGV